MAYYSSETCGYVNGSSVETGCTTDYAQSDIKYVVDAWAVDKFQASDSSVDATGYSARLITYDELINNLGYNNAPRCNPLKICYRIIEKSFRNKIVSEIFVCYQKRIML